MKILRYRNNGSLAKGGIFFFFFFLHKKTRSCLSAGKERATLFTAAAPPPPACCRLQFLPLTWLILTKLLQGIYYYEHRQYFDLEP